jgi:hypothetical protein
LPKFLSKYFSLCPNFCPNTSVFPCQCHFTNVPYSFIYH